MVNMLYDWVVLKLHFSRSINLIGSQHIFIHWAEGFKLKLALVTEFTAETIVAIFVLSVMYKWY